MPHLTESWGSDPKEKTLPKKEGFFRAVGLERIECPLGGGALLALVAVPESSPVVDNALRKGIS